MTYGWAILIIAIVLVALFSLNLFNPYTFAPKASAGSCSILRPNGPGSNLFVSAVGPACTINEIPEYVAKFNGQTSYVSLGNNMVLSPEAGTEGKMTMCVWFMPLSLTNWHGFVLKGISSPSNGDAWEYIIGQGTTNIYTIFNAGGANIAWYNPSLPDANSWQFTCFTYDYPASNSFVYMDGNQYTASFTTGGGAASQGTGALILGAGENGYSNVDLANFQLYNTSLSPTAVNTLYNEGIGGAPVDIQNLVGWWPLNGNANDYSGNNNNGVPTNVIFTSSWTSGYSTP